MWNVIKWESNLLHVPWQPVDQPPRTPCSQNSLVSFCSRYVRRLLYPRYPVPDCYYAELKYQNLYNFAKAGYKCETPFLDATSSHIPAYSIMWTLYCYIIMYEFITISFPPLKSRIISKLHLPHNYLRHLTRPIHILLRNNKLLCKINKFIHLIDI